MQSPNTDHMLRIPATSTQIGNIEITRKNEGVILEGYGQIQIYNEKLNILALSRKNIIYSCLENESVSSYIQKHSQ